MGGAMVELMCTEHANSACAGEMCYLRSYMRCVGKDVMAAEQCWDRSNQATMAPACPMENVVQCWEGNMTRCINETMRLAPGANTMCMGYIDEHCEDFEDDQDAMYTCMKTTLTLCLLTSGGEGMGHGGGNEDEEMDERCMDSATQECENTADERCYLRSYMRCVRKDAMVAEQCWDRSNMAFTDPTCLAESVTDCWGGNMTVCLS